MESAKFIKLMGRVSALTATVFVWMLTIGVGVPYLINLHSNVAIVAAIVLTLSVVTAAGVVFIKVTKGPRV